MNTAEYESKRRHRAYVHCCELNLKEWLTPEGLKTNGEFCAMEKNTWLNHMREHLPVQYDNIMRMEQMNF
jgi:hypothetical protein